MPIVKATTPLSDENLIRVLSYSVGPGYDIEIDGEFVKDEGDKKKKEPVFFEDTSCPNKYGFSLAIVKGMVVLTAEVDMRRHKFTVGAPGGEELRKLAVQSLKVALRAKGVVIAEDGKDSVISFSRDQLKTNDFLRTTPMGEVDVFLDKIKKDSAAREKIAKEILAVASDLDKHINKSKDIEKIKAYRKTQFEKGGKKALTEGYEKSVYTYPKQIGGDEGYPEEVIKRKRVKIPDSPFWISIGVVNGEFVIAAQEDRMYLGNTSQQMTELREALGQNEVFRKVFEEGKKPDSDIVYGGNRIYFAQNAFPILKSQEKSRPAKPMPPKKEEARSKPTRRLGAKEKMLLRRRVDPSYWYYDDDIDLISRARNSEQGICRVTLPSGAEGGTIDSGILARKENVRDNAETKPSSEVRKDRFVRNSEGGLVVEWEAIYLGGENDDTEIDNIKQRLGAALRFAHNGASKLLDPYPIKIIFPYNPHRGHWIAGEIMLYRGDRGYSARLTQYNPTSHYSESLDADFRTTFEGTCNEVIKQIEGDRAPNIEILPAKREAIGISSGGGKQVVQKDGSSCGVYTAYAIDKLKSGKPNAIEPQDVWDDFPDHTAGARKQRVSDLEAVHNMFARGIIDQERFARFTPARVAGATRFKSQAILVAEAQQAIKLYLEGAKDARALQAMQSIIHQVNERQAMPGREQIWAFVFRDTKLLLALLGGNARGTQIAGKAIDPTIFDIFVRNVSSDEKQRIIEGAVINGYPAAQQALFSAVLEGIPAAGNTTPAFVPPVVGNVVLHDIPPKKPNEIKKKIIADDKSLAPEGLEKAIANLEQQIQENFADKEVLSELLLSLMASQDESFKFAAAERLIAAGATVMKGAIIKRPADTATEGLYAGLLQQTLRNEYFLSLCKTATEDEIKAFLGEHNVDLAYVSMQHGSNALHCIAQNPNGVNPNMFLRAGLDINAYNNHGQTPLIVAVMYRANTAVMQLIASKADVELRDSSYDLNALEWAKSYLDEASKDGSLGYAAKTMAIVGYEEIIGKLAEKVKDPEPSEQFFFSTAAANQRIGFLLQYCDTTDVKLDRETLERAKFMLQGMKEFVEFVGRVSAKEEAMRNDDESRRYYKEFNEMLTWLTGVQDKDFDAEGEGISTLFTALAAQFEISPSSPTSSRPSSARSESESESKPGENRSREIAPPLPPKKPAAPKEPEMPSIPKLPRQLREDRRDGAEISHKSKSIESYDLVTVEDRYAVAQEIRQKRDVEAQARKTRMNLKRDIVHETFSLDRSDFFDKEVRKRLQDDGTYVKPKGLPYVVITPSDLQFTPCADYEMYVPTTKDASEALQEADTYVKLAGRCAAILQPETRNSTKAFQPYYANFGGMCFKEIAGGSAKIFGSAHLFSANFRNCVFENVDFSEIPQDIFATIEFNQCNFIKVDFSQFSVATFFAMGFFEKAFNKCSFQGCTFPDGVIIKEGKLALNPKVPSAQIVLDAKDAIESKLIKIRHKEVLIAEDTAPDHDYVRRKKAIAELRVMISEITSFEEKARERSDEQFLLEASEKIGALSKEGGESEGSYGSEFGDDGDDDDRSIASASSWLDASSVPPSPRPSPSPSPSRSRSASLSSILRSSPGVAVGGP